MKQICSTWWGVVLVVSLLPWGCGRKATLEDCQQIVARIVELELARVRNAAELATEIERAKEDMRGQAMSECVGRRIRSDSLQCVREATDSEQLIEDCFAF